MKRSTETEMQAVADLISTTRDKIETLLRSGKKVHMVWDFDGVLSDSRSDDVAALTNGNLELFFECEERLLLQSPGIGPWLLPIAHNTGISSRFPSGHFTQDIVTARSSALAMRVHIFCFAWNLKTRWTLSLGHQPKKEGYRIILRSLKDDHDCHIFCVDDNVKHIASFCEVAQEEGIDSRSLGILSPVIRNYDGAEIQEYLARVMSAAGREPIRVRDPSDERHGFLVLPEGLGQFRGMINSLVDQKSEESHVTELRQAFTRTHGEVGEGRFQSEEELRQAMREFVLDIVT